MALRLRPWISTCFLGVLGTACATGTTDGGDTSAGATSGDTSDTSTSDTSTSDTTTTDGTSTTSGAGGANASTSVGATSTTAAGSGGGTSASASAAASGSSTASTSATSSATSSGAGGGGNLPTCGNGKLDAGEQCDAGAMNSDAGACTTMCMKAKCGDGLVQKGVEACDDANAIDGDGCNANCVVSGTPVWTQTFDQADEVWNGVVVDGAGSIIVAGTTVGAFDLDIVVRKYDATGKIIWTKTFDGGTNDSGNAIAVDAAGSIVVVGSQEDFDGSKDIAVRKLSGTGALVWSQAYNAGVAGADDVGYGVAIDAKGDVLLAGALTVSPVSQQDLLVAKVTGAAGDIVWADVVNGVSNADDVGNAVHVDAKGAVLVAGAVVGANKNDVFMRKYTDNGTSASVVWSKVFNGASNGDDFGFGIASDSKGNVLVSGAEFTAAQSYNVWVGKLDPDGNTVWTKGYNGKANLVDAAGAISATPTDDVVLGGYEQLADKTLDVWARKLTSNGDVVWTQSYNGNASGDDAIFALAVDAAGFTYGAGQETTVATGIDAWLRKFAP